MNGNILIITLLMATTLLGCAKEKTTTPKEALRKYLTLVEAEDWKSMAQYYEIRGSETEKDLVDLERYLSRYKDKMKKVLNTSLESDLPADATDTRVVFKPWVNGYFEINLGEDGVWRWRW